MQKKNNFISSDSNFMFLIVERFPLEKNTRVFLLNNRLAEYSILHEVYYLKKD